MTGRDIVNEPDTGQLLTMSEVAEALRQSRQSVYRHVQRGELRALQIGSGPKAPLRIRAGELERFLTSTPSNRPKETS
jgi:excisionase family DNA binding protein